MSVAAAGAFSDSDFNPRENAVEEERAADEHSVRTSDMSISSFSNHEAESSSSSSSSSNSSLLPGPGGVRARGPVVRSGVPEIRLDIPGRGSVRHNTVLSFFRAVCCRHPNCNRQRTAEPSEHPSRSGQGRPLGFLVAWLLQDEHVSAKLRHADSNAPSLQSRQEARQYLKGLCGHEAYSEFAENECPLKDGEAEEPEGLP